jgi:asparagine synthase (glutamine-hydrolysing)
MCGYTVLFYKKKKILSSKKIKFLKNSQCHRGPDTKKYLRYNNIYFFHNRLKIIDIKKKSDQPFVSKVSGNVIVFNGEIYNFIELKKKLKNHFFYTNSDTEVLLYLYEQEGENFFKYINGIFSFVIYDKKKNILLSGRDRFGVKPIYSYIDNEKVILSTEIKPILYLNNNKFEFNLIEIKKYLSEGLIYNKNQTFFKNVLLEYSSTYRIFSIRNFKFIKKKKYWYLKKQKKLECSNYTEFYKKFISLFKESLRLNIVSNVEVALLLSSGLDSYFLKCFFEKNFHHKIKTFTCGWKNKKYDEITKIKKLIKVNNGNLFKRFSGYKILKELRKIIYFSEGPIGGFGTASVYLLMNYIKKKNIKVLLSGEGSDEIFLGYYNFRILFLYSIINKKALFSKELKSFNKLETGGGVNN